MRGVEHDFVEVRDRTLNIRVNGVDTKVRFRVSDEKPPTGLASVAWTRNFEHVGIKIFGVYYKQTGSIIWTASQEVHTGAIIPKYGWAISDEPDLWGSVNTLGYKGKRWTYADPNSCMMGLIKYVVQCLTTGNMEWK